MSVKPVIPVLATIAEWHKVMVEVDNQADVLRALTGGVEGPLFEAIDNTMMAYTKAIGALTGDIGADWLQWWWLDCDMGKNPKRASTQKTRRGHMIYTIEQLAELIADGES